ncbi:MAG TPA: class I SAM-dependent methyltransferase [Polyangia bacterium]|nr:class I SAM-dependent methyltransferase [Polyangia bacterium]HWE26377.1 class I SAM-dependent methyltransferase [Polyangia bacterium]
MPDETFIAKLYSPEYLDRHYGDGDASAEIGRELRDTAQAAARARPGGKLIDVGCGAGGFLGAARDAGLRVEGHELLPLVAQATAAATGLPVHSGALATIGERYDVVHLADVVEHVAHPLEILIASRELLAPNGLLIARGPLEQQANLFQRAVRWQRIVKHRLGRARPIEMPPWHISQFTLRGWHTLLSRAGLRVVEERLYETRWPAPDAVSLQPSSLLKLASTRLSASPVGRGLRLGNRVVSWLAAA